jgi:hypothetical protein
MADFFGAWCFVLVLGSPFIVLVLATILPISRSNPAGYKMGWRNLLYFFGYSFVIVLYAYILELKPGNGGVGFAALFNIVPISLVHLLFFWIWLYKVKPKKLSEATEKNSTQKDPILDEQPPTK